jgi:hypothetical protein
MFKRVQFHASRRSQELDELEKEASSSEGSDSSRTADSASESSTVDSSDLEVRTGPNGQKLADLGAKAGNKDSDEEEEVDDEAVSDKDSDGRTVLRCQVCPGKIFLRTEDYQAHAKTKTHRKIIRKVYLLSHPTVVQKLREKNIRKKESEVTRRKSRKRARVETISPGKIEALKAKFERKKARRMERKQGAATTLNHG